MNSVLLVTVDCLRADHVGCYGYDRETTPRIDRFSESATRFENAYANTPSTRWTMQGITTGVWKPQISGQGVPDTGHSTLPELFQGNAYRTAALANNPNFSRHYDFDRGYDFFRGAADFQTDTDVAVKSGKWMNEAVSNDRFQQWLSYAYNEFYLPLKGTVDDSSIGPTDRELVDIATEWISEKRRENEAFFAWVHLMDAHTPYPRCPDHLAAIGGDTDRSHIYNPTTGDLDDPEHRRRSFDVYDSAVRSADEQVGRLIDVVSDDATVLVTADHAEDFGEDVGFHTISAYSSMTQIPFLVRSQNIEPGEREEPVQLLDIPPTLAREIGAPVPDHWVGEPLQRIDWGTDRPIFWTVTGKEHGCGVRVGDWKIVTTYESDEPAELYRCEHMEREGEELGAEYPEKRAELADLLSAHVDSLRSQRIGEARSGWDDEEGREDLSESMKTHLEELGYLD